MKRIIDITKRTLFLSATLLSITSFMQMLYLAIFENYGGDFNRFSLIGIISSGLALLLILIDTNTKFISHVKNLSENDNKKET
ncbi:hypothetical protein [Caviibacter abscessus]|uniref:hypothetical protein n=1 Tax=Caviibacter abscessus TaxID=1766719 RepID=UPI000838C62C|nr:hypothetical protein [Caviibacter abscessus]